MNIPYPKQVLASTQDLTRDQRLRVQTLFNDANFAVSQIALQTGYTPRQIRYALANRLTPQKHKTGRKVLLNTPQIRG